MTDETRIAARVEAEIIELHEFFVRWFQGTCAQDAATWARVETALDPRFFLVSPDGHLLTRKTLLDGIYSVHGSHAAPRTFEIWIENFTLRSIHEHTIIVTYEEWQRRDGEVRGRQSSATLAEDDTQPHGHRWLHVHETWLPDASR